MKDKRPPQGASPLERGQNNKGSYIGRALQVQPVLRTIGPPPRCVFQITDDDNNNMNDDDDDDDGYTFPVRGVRASSRGMSLRTIGPALRCVLKRNQQNKSSGLGRALCLYGSLRTKGPPLRCVLKR